MKSCLKWVAILGGIFVVVSIIIVMAAGGSTTSQANRPPATSSSTPTVTPDPEQIKTSAIEIEYKDLHRNIEMHVGKTIRFEGEIVQSSEMAVLFGNNYTVFRVMLDEGDVVWSEYHGNERFLEDDSVTIWASVNGLHTYETIMGASIELPSVTILLIELT